MTQNKDWFVSWFNTSYYHILYKHRDHTEAQSFIRILLGLLNFKKEDSLLDLGCGKGRHSIYLNSLGYRITGYDLSNNSIQYAKQFENSRMKFKVHDMRDPFESKFDAVLNLFTSFGFFEDDKVDIEVLQHIKNSLNSEGIAIVDFMNSKKVISELIPREIVNVDGITFQIKRTLENGFIVKQIQFEAEGSMHTYYEKVKCLDLQKIKSYLKSVNFKIKHTFGNYQLEPFNQITSDRLILVLE
jgi:SAM-dependent methyltransferase